MPAPPPSRSIENPIDVAVVAAGGAVGTALRAALLLVAEPNPGQIPWMTAAENLVGAFSLGLIVMVLLRRAGDAHRLQLFLATGVLGSFTTFSALAVESLHLVRLGAGTGAGLYLLVSIPGGVLAAMAGLMAGRRVRRRRVPS